MLNLSNVNVEAMRFDSTRVEMHFPFPFQAAPAQAKIIENRSKMSS